MKITLLTSVLTFIILLSFPLGQEDAQLVDLSRTQFVERNFQVVKNLKEERCLTEAIYYEAGNQGELGKEAVALVVLNRVGAPKRPKTICGVVSQAHVVQDVKICQFSFWCETKRKPVPEVWKESQKIAQRVLQNYWKRDILSKYDKAVYFHADYVKPQWRKHKVYLGKIDKHLFYGEKETCQTQ
jgi:spore germination cell wall hydrolase CwlJ-like protein